MIDLSAIVLAAGGHSSRENGVCLLEAVAWYSGEPHSDRPVCVSPVLGTFGRTLNDRLPKEKRQLLLPLVPLMPGTAGDGMDEARSYMALDWLIRTYTPAWLELAGCDAAAELRSLRRIVDMSAARAAGPVVRTARARAAAARAAARDAAGDAAWAAAWAAARDAARDAAGDAARAAARDAAGDAAWAAAWAAARDAARDAAGDAARDAARDVLAPTVERLQDSAIDLLKSMIAPSLMARKLARRR